MKRYETYKNSGVEWIGEIPEGWEVLKLKYAFNILDYLRQPISSENRSRNNPIYDYYGASGIIDRIDDYNVDDKVLLIGEDGANLVMRNLPLIYKAEGKFWVNNHAHILKPKDGIDYDYMYYTLEMADYSTFITGSAQPKLSQENLCNVEYPIPSLSEQQQISSYLDYKVGQIDSSLAKIVEQIEDLKSYRQSVISEAVTKGLNPNAKMKDSGVEWIGEIPEGWKVRNLKYLTEKIGSGVTPTGGAEVYQDHGVIFLRSQNIYPTGLKLTDVAYISEEIDERMCATRVKKGDVLLNITGASIGRCACYNIDDRANVNQHVCIIRPLSEQLYADFLQYVLNSNLGQNSINYVQNGANREGLNFEQIKKFSIPLPPFSEQQQIASYLDSKTSKIDSSIQALELQKSQLEDYKRSVISEAVTGKVDLRGWKQKCEQ